MDIPMKFKASPGIAIIEGVDEKDEKALVLTTKVTGRIIKGKIVSMGSDDTTSMGEIIHASNYGKEGDEVYFLHYYEEGGVDVGEIDGKKYYFVKWGDFRAQQNG